MQLVPVYDAMVDFLPKLEEELTKIVQKSNPDIEKVGKHDRFYFDDTGKIHNLTYYGSAMPKQNFSFWNVYIDVFGENLKKDSIELFYMINHDEEWEAFSQNRSRQELILIEAMKNLNKADIFIEAKLAETFDVESGYVVHLYWSW